MNSILQFLVIFYVQNLENHDGLGIRGLWGYFLPPAIYSPLVLPTLKRVMYLYMTEMRLIDTFNDGLRSTYVVLVHLYNLCYTCVY